MRTHSMKALLIAVLLAAVSTTQAEAQTADVAGAWNLTVDVGGMVTTPTMTIEQDGEAVTGHYSSATLGEIDFTGTVTGPQLTFALEANVQGQAITATYNLTLNDDGTLSGTLDLAGLATGTVRGTRG